MGSRKARKKEHKTPRKESKGHDLYSPGLETLVRHNGASPNRYL